jgi:hypothetical protein
MPRPAAGKPMTSSPPALVKVAGHDRVATDSQNAPFIAKQRGRRPKRPAPTARRSTHWSLDAISAVSSGPTCAERSGLGAGRRTREIQPCEDLQLGAKAAPGSAGNDHGGRERSLASHKVSVRCAVRTRRMRATAPAPTRVSLAQPSASAATIARRPFARGARAIENVFARRSLEQLVKGLALVLAKSSQDVVLDRGERLFCLTELGDPGGGYFDHVAPTILGRSAAGRETVILEVVQETDHVRLVHLERGPEVLLREAAVVAQQRQCNKVARAEPVPIECRLGTCAGQPRQVIEQRRRAMLSSRTVGGRCDTTRIDDTQCATRTQIVDVSQMIC